MLLPLKLSLILNPLYLKMCKNWLASLKVRYQQHKSFLQINFETKTQSSFKMLLYTHTWHFSTNAKCKSKSIFEAEQNNKKNNPWIYKNGAAEPALPITLSLDIACSLSPALSSASSASAFTIFRFKLYLRVDIEMLLDRFDNGSFTKFAAWFISG